jgi:hypothetical protein
MGGSLAAPCLKKFGSISGQDGLTATDEFVSFDWV